MSRYTFFALRAGEASDCSYRKAHHPEQHRPHPRTGRLVCFVCHPPVEVILEKANAAR